jgi:6-pyruvoyltetrahydropterin/6-carboxytetrahydropterin synthase
MPHIITVSFEFSAAKRLTKYEGKCAFLHGYRHKLEVSFSGALKNGIVVDFYEVKEKISNWLNANWDHNVLLNKSDKKLGSVIENYTGQKIYYLNDDPTAENLSEYFKEKICKKLFPKLKITKVKLFDDANASVEI